MHASDATQNIRKCMQRELHLVSINQQVCNFIHKLLFCGFAILPTLFDSLFLHESEVLYVELLSRKFCG